MQTPSDPGTQPSMQEIMRLAQTPEGRQIIAVLKKKNSPLLSSVVSCAMNGDYEAVRQGMNALLRDPEIQALLTKLEEHK